MYMYFILRNYEIMKLWILKILIILIFYNNFLFCCCEKNNRSSINIDISVNNDELEDNLEDKEYKNFKNADVYVKKFIKRVEGYIARKIYIFLKKCLHVKITNRIF